MLHTQSSGQPFMLQRPGSRKYILNKKNKKHNIKNFFFLNRKNKNIYPIIGPQTFEP